MFLTHPLLLVGDHLLHGGERWVIYAEVVRDEGDVPGDKLPGHERRGARFLRRRKHLRVEGQQRYVVLGLRVPPKCVMSTSSVMRYVACACQRRTTVSATASGDDLLGQDRLMLGRHKYLWQEQQRTVVHRLHAALSPHTRAGAFLSLCIRDDGQHAPGSHTNGTMTHLKSI